MTERKTIPLQFFDEVANDSGELVFHVPVKGVVLIDGNEIEVKAGDTFTLDRDTWEVSHNGTLVGKIKPRQ